MLSLRPGSARALAQSTVQRAAREGVSADRTLASLRAAGAGYRRQTFLADYRQYAGRERLVDPLRSVRRDRMPTESLMSQARRPKSGRYLYTVEIKLAGRDESLYRNIASNRRLTRGEAEDRAIEPGRQYGGWEDRAEITAADLRYIDRAG